MGSKEHVFIMSSKRPQYHQIGYFLESITGILERSGVCLYVPSSRKNKIIAFKRANFLLYQLQLAFFLIPDTISRPKLMHSEQGEKGSTRNTNGKETRL